MDSYAYMFTKAVLTLIVLLGLTGALLYIVKNHLKKGGVRDKRPGVPVKLLTSSFLGQKKNIAIMDVAGEILVLGVTPTSITFLTKVERPEAVEELKKLGANKPGLLNFFQ